MFSITIIYTHRQTQNAYVFVRYSIYYVFHNSCTPIRFITWSPILLSYDINLLQNYYSIQQYINIYLIATGFGVALERERGVTTNKFTHTFTLQYVFLYL